MTLTIYKAYATGVTIIRQQQKIARGRAPKISPILVTAKPLPNLNFMDAKLPKKMNDIKLNSLTDEDLKDVFLNKAVIDKRDSDDLAREADEKQGIIKIKTQKKLIKYKSQHYSIVEKEQDMLNFPDVGEQYRIITQASFNAFSMVLRILEDSDIEEIYLATFNIKETIILAIFELLKAGRIKSLNLMLSESITFRMPQRIALLHNLFDEHKEYDVRIKLNWNHAKIMLIKAGGFFCVEGSGNLSDNAQIEQYTMDNNRELYDFHKNWMDHAFENKTYKREKIFS